HVYDVRRDPGETTNLVGGPETDFLRAELVAAALELGLDLRGFENPADGVNAMMAMDGSVVLAGGNADNDYWAYGEAAERIVEAPDGGNDTLWYMAGPDGYTLRVPANIENVRLAAVVARMEADRISGKVVHIVAHPDSAIHFESSERVAVHVVGSREDDVMIGPKYAGATFEGGEGNDRLIALSGRRNDHHAFYGGPGDDYLKGGNGRDTLDGGPGDDEIYGGDGFNRIYGGPGNDFIMDGEHSSVIHTGPGRNRVISGPGKDQFFVGPGENTITGGEGGVTYVIAYSGVCTITDWRTGDVIDLTGWPGVPAIERMGEDTVIALGLSAVVLQGAPDPLAVAQDCRMPG
ncbi:MAG: sulfatase, partial [Paracoccaceae bacterium]|nr:sulfatase [Paracoccaceae bacterium]